jgi:GntR family transcriptional regulator
LARRSDSRPRHEQIAAVIRAQIMAGDLPPGTQLPSTPNLVAQYSAANATIQSALAALKEEGFLYSQVGKGVYVRDRRPLVIDVAAYFAPSQGGYSYQLLDVTEVESPPEVAEALALAAGDAVILRHRLLLHDGEPVELAWSYYPASIVRDTELSRRKKIAGGAPRALADLGYPQHDFLDRLSVRMPTTEEVELLELPGNVPVIRQLRVVRSVGDRPVEVSVLVKGGHLHELRYHQRVQPEAG